MIRDADRVAWASEVDQALRTLGRDEETFIRLSYFTGLDRSAIAESAGVSVATVSRTIATGMRRFDRAMETLRVGPPSVPGSEPRSLEP